MPVRERTAGSSGLRPRWPASPASAARLGLGALFALGGLSLDALFLGGGLHPRRLSGDDGHLVVDVGGRRPAGSVMSETCIEAPMVSSEMSISTDGRDRRPAWPGRAG